MYSYIAIIIIIRVYDAAAVLAKLLIFTKVISVYGQKFLNIIIKWSAYILHFQGFFIIVMAPYWEGL